MDSQSYTPVLNGTLGNGSQWLHKTPDSSGFQQEPWNDPKRFEFRVNREEFQKALADLRNTNVSVCDYCGTFSADPADYILEQVNMNAKVYDATAASWGKLGMAYSQMMVALYETPVYDRVYIRGALAVDSSHLTATPTTQVFFKNPGDADYSEGKSLRANMTLGGGWHEIVLDMSANPAWKGTLSGLRVDPFDSIPLSAAEGFGIDYIYVGDANRNYIRTWDFNGATGPSNPFFGWQLAGISNHWTDGNYWGGSTNTGQPRFSINKSFPTGK
ncbi:MAG TPA: hypothetical protein VD886_21570 [Herpetosiphonaceae bacterium]|nr:hypothetical protein [Herpetosiphonaceae bacterium]